MDGRFVRVNICLSDGIFYGHKHDLRLELESRGLPAEEDSHDIEILLPTCFPFTAGGANSPYYAS